MTSLFLLFLTCVIKIVPLWLRCKTTAICIEKPWITKGQRNACKKKNMLYKRTKEAKKNTKVTKIWKLLRGKINKIINKRKINQNDPLYFYSDNDIIKNNSKKIKKQFNIKWTLCKCRKNTANSTASSANVEVNLNIITRNTHSMFIIETDIVHKRVDSEWADFRRNVLFAVHFSQQVADFGGWSGEKLSDVGNGRHSTLSLCRLCA